MFIRQLTLALGFSLFATSFAYAQTCPTYPNTLTNGTTADATAVMGNFNSILNCANTSLAPSSGGTLTNTTLGGMTTFTNPAAARGPSGLVIDSLCTSAATSYTIASTCRQLQTSAALSGASTWTLPAASSFNAGETLEFKDAAGGITSTNTLTIAHAGSDTINGAASALINSAYGGIILTSDGSSKWTFIPVTTTASGTVTNIATDQTLAGGPITTTGTLKLNPNYYPSGFVNKFRNGTFDIWQRGISGITISTAASCSTTLSACTAADGWGVIATGANVTAARATFGPIAGYPLYGLQITGAASNTDVSFEQRIESYIATGLAGKTVTVQFYVYQTTGSAVTPKISTCYASSQDTFSTCTADLAATNITSCATATNCLESYTFSVSQSANNGYQIKIDCGAIVASQTCVITGADIRATPGVTTGVNSNPPPPELRPIFTELAFSQRYFATSYANGTTPGGTDIADAVGAAQTNSTGQFAGKVSFPIEMRAAPSISYWDTAGNASKCSQYGSNTLTPTTNLTCNQAPGNISTTGFVFVGNGSSNGASCINYTASAEL
jgi:hypothetical protein